MKRLPELKLDLNFLWLITPIVVCLVILLITPLNNDDLWWHIKTGEEIFSTRHIPQIDNYSLTVAGQAYPFSRYWLSELFLYLVNRGFGLSGLVILQALVGALIVGLLTAESFQRHANPRAIAFILLIVILFPLVDARPQMFSYLFFTLYTWILWGYWYQRNNKLWVLPIIMVFWVNSHPGWVLGFLLLGLLDIIVILEILINRRNGSGFRSLLIWSIVTAVVMLINPRGWRIIYDVAITSSNPVVRQFVSEWQPTSMAYSFTLPFFFLLFLLLVGLAYSRRRPDLYEFSSLVVFLGLSFRFIRSIPFYYFVAAPTLAVLISGLPLPKLTKQVGFTQTKHKERKTLNTLIFLAMLAAIFFVSPFIRLRITGQPESVLVNNHFPQGAANYLANLDQQDIRLFNLQDWSGYLLWRLYPQARVFMTSGIELFTPETISDYFIITQAESGWLERLRAYNIDYLVLSKERQPILIAAANEKKLPVVYSDEVAIIYSVP